VSLDRRASGSLTIRSRARYFDVAVISVFHAACRDLGEIAQAAKAAQKTLAERAFNALNENDYGQYDELISVLSPALGPTGLEELKNRFIELSKAPPEQPKGKNRKVIGWGADSDEVARV
jgi:hypothetical protein